MNRCRASILVCSDGRGGEFVASSDPGTERLAVSNSAAGSKPGKISVGIDCGSLSSAMFSLKDGRFLQADAIFCR